MLFVVVVVLGVLFGCKGSVNDLVGVIEVLDVFIVFVLLVS